MIWYIIVTFLISNLVIAFVLEIYGETEHKIIEKHKQRRLIIKIYDKFKNRDSLDVPEDELADVNDPNDNAI